MTWPRYACDDPPGLTLVTPPAVEPVSHADLKLHARVEIDDEDELIDLTIAAARRYAEERLGQSFITQTWALALDRFPAHEVRLPRPPLLAVSGVTYKDLSGITQTLSASVYEVDTKRRPGRLLLAYAQYWPVLYTGSNVVTITYTAGYGPAASDVPGPIRLAIAQLAAHWLENREAVAEGRPSEVPLAAHPLLDSCWHGTY